MLSKQVEAEVNQYLEAATDGLKLAAYTIESMLESHESHEAILDQLTEQSTAVEKAVFVDTTGLYGYIDGEYLDGAGWVPDDDYEPTTRPWYTETIANGNEITTIDPYVDSLTGGIIMSFAKTLKDGKSVVSIDFDMARIQEIIEEYSSSDDNNTQIILDNNNLIIIHVPFFERHQSGYETQLLAFRFF